MTFLWRVVEQAGSSGFISRKVETSASSAGRAFSKRFVLFIRVRVTACGFVPGAGVYCWLPERRAHLNGVGVSSAAGLISPAEPDCGEIGLDLSV